MKLTDVIRFDQSNALYSKERLWELFSGRPDCFNIAYECIGRHASDPSRVAVRIAHSDGRRESLTFANLDRRSAQFAQWLVDQGVAPGDRVAFMLEPCEAFYVSLFGALRAGAIGVPLFTLFGPDGLRLRVADCRPRVLVTTPDKAETAQQMEGVKVVVVDEAFWAELDSRPGQFERPTKASDLAILQDTSATTRAL